MTDLRTTIAEAIRAAEQDRDTETDKGVRRDLSFRIVGMKEIRDAVLAVLPEPQSQQDGWKPIAEADEKHKDGRPVLGWVIGKRYDDQWPDVVTYDDIFNVWMIAGRQVTVSHFKDIDLSGPTTSPSQPPAPTLNPPVAK